mmetsp:Transcript_19520/g.52051  ORF Transcript_19520/g.52051 Transcript_19520/m.52051 type:complete len:95 (-) Transcript_19520:265-549(-)
MPIFPKIEGVIVGVLSLESADQRCAVRSRVMGRACAVIGFLDWCLIANFKWKCRALSLRRSKPRRQFSKDVIQLASTAWTSCLGDHRLYCGSWS